AQILAADRRHHLRHLLRQRGVDLRQTRHDDACLAIHLGEIEIVVEAATAQRVRELARAVGGEHHARNRARLHGAEFRNADLEIRQELEQEGLELLIRAVDLVDQQDRRIEAAYGGEQRPFQQVLFGKNVLLDAVGVLALAHLDGEQLALIVPFVQRGVLVEALVALQPDQFGAVYRRQRLADLGLADAGLALQQQRPLEEIHQPQRHGKIAVSDIADPGESLGDVVAVLVRFRRGVGWGVWKGGASPGGVARGTPPARRNDWRVSARHAAGPFASRVSRLYPPYGVCSPSLSAAIQVRQWSCGIGMCVEPRNAKASLTAFAKHGTPPTFGLSPTPLAPIGWGGDVAVVQSVA